MKRVDLIARLETALEDLYHNATPTYPDLESDYEQDLFQSWFEDHARFEIEDLKHDDIHGRLVRLYGPVYQYGRGGRTLAPSKLIVDRGASFRVARPDDLDLSPLEARQLIRMIEAFNRDAAAWCRDVANAWREAIEVNDWQQEIDANAGKRRATVRVYR
jgi:hypothetical protein